MEEATRKCDELKEMLSGIKADSGGQKTSYRDSHTGLTDPAGSKHKRQQSGGGLCSTSRGEGATVYSVYD